MSEVQRSSEWHANRCGRITASRMQHVLAVAKRDGKPLQARADYVTELVLERLTGEPEGIPTTPPMQWGKDVEPAAIAAYEARTGAVVQSTGFIVHPAIPNVGASPDGLVGDDGGIEIKCPWKRSIHLETLRTGMPEEHITQVQCGLWVTGRKWWDFISFDPRFPPALRLFIVRVTPDKDFIGRMRKECAAVEIEVTNALSELLGQRAAA